MRTQASATCYIVLYLPLHVAVIPSASNVSSFPEIKVTSKHFQLNETVQTTLLRLVTALLTLLKGSLSYIKLDVVERPNYKEHFYRLLLKKKLNSCIIQKYLYVPLDLNLMNLQIVSLIHCQFLLCLKS